MSICGEQVVLQTYQVGDMAVVSPPASYLVECATLRPLPNAAAPGEQGQQFLSILLLCWPSSNLSSLADIALHEAGVVCVAL